MVVTFAMLYLAVAAPLLEYYRNCEAKLETQRLLAERRRAAAAEVPQLRERLTSLGRSAGTQKMTLSGHSDALASAELQSHIEELARTAGVSISSIEGLPVDVRAGYRRIGLRVAVGGAYEAVIKLLSAIETTTPPLIVESLQIHAGARAATMHAAQLDAAYIIYGFRGSSPSGEAKP